MRKSLIIIAAATGLLALPAAAGELRTQSTELSSQSVYIGPGGVRVDPDGRRDRRWRERRYWRDREVRGPGCKTVTVRETRPNGSVVTRTRTRC
jgi:hypothetical protein